MEKLIWEAGTLFIILVSFTWTIYDTRKKFKQKEDWKKIGSKEPINEPYIVKPRYNWNLEFLMSLEWKRYEEVCQKYLTIRGDDARLTSIGADGGVDIKVYKDSQVSTLIQCKAWNWKVGVKEVRELYGVMASERVDKGIFMTTSSFTQEAINFCKDKNLVLIGGDDLIRDIQKLPHEQQQALFDFTIRNDYTTPTCPGCDIKMVKYFNHDLKKNYWKCPKCRMIMKMRV